MHPSPLPLPLSIFFHRRIRKLNANQPETRFTCNKSRAYGWDNIDKIVVKRCFIPVERVERLVSPLVKCIHVSRNKNKKKKIHKNEDTFPPVQTRIEIWRDYGQRFINLLQILSTRICNGDVNFYNRANDSPFNTWYIYQNIY